MFLSNNFVLCLYCISEAKYQSGAKSKQTAESKQTADLIKKLKFSFLITLHCISDAQSHC